MKEGYYWVQVYEGHPWEVAHIAENGHVILPCYSIGFHAKELFSIGDIIETPEKYRRNH